MARSRYPEGVSLSFVDLLSCAFGGLIMLLFTVLSSGGSSTGNSVSVMLVTVDAHYPRQPRGASEEVEANGRSLGKAKPGDAFSYRMPKGQRYWYSVNSDPVKKDKAPFVRTWTVLAEFREAGHGQNVRLLFDSPDDVLPTKFVVTFHDAQGRTKSEARDAPGDGPGRKELNFFVGEEGGSAGEVKFTPGGK